MAIINRHGKGTRILVNGYDMSPILNDATVDRTVDTAETTCFTTSTGGDTKDRTYIPGHRSASATLAGLYTDDGTNGGSTSHLDGVFDDVLGATTSPILSIAPGGGSTIGSDVWLLEANEIARAATAPLSDAVRTSMSVQASGAAPLGKWVAHPATRPFASTEQNLAAVNLGGSTTAQTGYVAHLHVLGGSTSTGADLTVTIQDSSDSATWVDLPTQFAAHNSTDGRGQQRVAVSTAACLDRVRAQYVQLSTSLTWAVGIGRVPV